MGKLIVVNNISLDGVMQAPGRVDEDTRDGFAHGGWAVPYNDEIMGQTMAKRMAGNTGAMLFGRRTYEALYAFWPKQTDGNPYTEHLNRVRKYVVSTTLTEPLPWQNSALIKEDRDATAGAVAKLKQDTNVSVLGSGTLLRTLIRANLVDQYLLLIHPLVLGAGRRLFADDGTFAKLRLVDSVTTTTGVIMATYEPGGSE